MDAINTITYPYPIDTTSNYHFNDIDDNIISQVDLDGLMTESEKSADQSVEEFNIQSDDMDDIISQIDLDEMFGEVVAGNAEHSIGNGAHKGNPIGESVNASGGLPAEMMAQYQAAMDKLLPSKSATRYVQAYDVFLKWQEANSITSFTEEVMMCYFSQATEKYKPSTVWSMYSMLKKTLIAKRNIDISKHCQLIAFLKTNADGFESKKSEVFEAEEIQAFMLKAPNAQYLGMKAVMAFGVMGACRGDELTNMTTDYLQDNGKEIIVRIPTTKSKKPKMFQIDGSFADIVRAYSQLRPPNVPTNRFFLQYRGGKCTVQVMGKNSIAKIPKEVAKYLGLANHEAYTGHGLRRTSTTILADTGAGFGTMKRHGLWKQNKTVELYIEKSLHHKRKVGALISNAINLPSPNELGTTEEVPAKKSAPLMSTLNGIDLQSTSGEIPKSSQSRNITSTHHIAVESLSQICVTREAPVDDSSDAFGGPSRDATTMQEALKKIHLPWNKKSIVFHFAGPITNFNANMK